MVSTFTTARNLEKPAAGDQIGTWGTASINPDLDVIDAGMGQSVAISGAAGNVVLSAAQFRVAAITFNSTLVGSISITFPTSFTGPYSIFNTCTGSSAFIITLQTTTATGEDICAPPGQMVDIWNDGSNLRYRNLPMVGTVVPTMYSSMPAWVDGCSVKPYLNSDGSTFASSVYPALAVILGSTTLPDYRGRYRAALNQGTGRITSSQTGVDGNTRGASGGTVVLSSQNIPPVPITDPGHGHPARFDTQLNGNSDASGGLMLNSDANSNQPAFNGTPDATLGHQIGGNTTGITAGSTSPTGFVPPTAIAGITMIRAG